MTVRAPRRGATSLLRPLVADGPARTVLIGLLASLVMLGVVFAGPVPGPFGLLFVGVAAVVGVTVLGSPVLAVLVLLLASFLRIASNLPGLPAEPMWFALLALVAAAGVAWLRDRLVLRGGLLETAMVAYLTWNVISMVWPHELPAVEPATGDPISVYRFVLTGTVLPFLAYVVGRAVFRDAARVRVLLLGVLVLAGWSAAVSVVQFTGPVALVWPSYIVDNPTWPGRAVGIVNQPAVNGLLLVLGFVITMFLLRRPGLGVPARVALLVCAAACVLGVYVTYTRAVWAAFALGLVLCALFARGYRAGFVLVILAAVGYVGATWSTFTSSDREAGGVGSVGEVEDRLNTIATSLWGIEHKPFFGWGIGRFTALNTFHHQVWDQSIPYERGFAISSHQNELGIGAELGLSGLALWAAVLLLTVLALVRALRRLPAEGINGRALGLLAVTGFVTWLAAGFTVDLRFLDFANLVVFLLIGAAVGSADAVTEDGPTAAPVPSERAAARPVPAMTGVPSPRAAEPTVPQG